MELDPPVTPADRIGLGMQVRPVGDERHLFLATRRLFGWLELSEFELRVPSQSRAIGIDAAEEAIAYQRVRSEVVSARLRMAQGDIDAYVSGCGAALTALGVDELVLRCSDSYICLSARVREAARVADLSARIYLSAQHDRLRLSIGASRTYGHLNTPAPLLAHHLISALLQIDDDSSSSALGLCDFLLPPLRSALFHCLPAAGWRLPSLQTAPLATAEISEEGIELHFSESSELSAAGSQSSTELADSLQSFRAPDALLESGDLKGAMREYRGELAARGPEQPFLVERILSIASSNREFFYEGLELARQVLGRWPDFAPAHAAIASIAVAKDDIEGAATRYRELSQACRALGDEEGIVRAALVGALLLRQIAPDDSARLYEVVLEHRPGHPEAAEALADRYRVEERWADLLRLIRMRLAATHDPQMQARDHARLAEILVDERDDPEAALAELTAACRLDEGTASIYEQRANVEFLLGKIDEALVSLEWACDLHRVNGDERAQLRNLVRGGRGCFDANLNETAETWFLAAIEVSGGHSPALRGAACAAARLGHHEDASHLWKKLFDLGLEAPETQAYFACELGRSLLAIDAPDLALAPLERAAETGGVRTKAEALRLLGEWYLQRDATVEALTSWKSSIEQFSSHANDEAYGDEDSTIARKERAAELSLRRAEVAAKAGDDAEVLEDLERAFAISRPGSESRRRAARILLDRTPDNEEELGWIQELALGNTDQDECAYLDILRARLLAAEGDPQAGLEALANPLSSEGVGDTPKSAALQLKAEILETLGEASARADVLEKRASLSGSHKERAVAFIESAEGWFSADDSGRCSAALHSALQVIDSATPMPELRKRALQCLGANAWRSRQWGAVDDAYEEIYADAGYPAPQEQLLRWGIALENLGKSEDAKRVLERVSATESSSDQPAAQACRHLADLYERLGDFREAAAAQERYASSEVCELSSAAQADAWYRAGAIHRRGTDSAEDAKRCLDKALRIASDHLPALDALEQIARSEGAHERLAVILGRKVAVMSSHPARQRGLLVRLAQLQEQLGRTDVARETYRRVLTIAPTYRPALLFAAHDAQASGNHPFASEALGLLAGPLEHDNELSLGADEIAAQQQEATLDLAALVVGTAGQVASESVTSLLLREAHERDEFIIWTALAAAYRRQANFLELADTLGHLIKHAEAEQALDLSLERIKLLANDLGDHGGALIALRIAEEIDPENEDLARWYGTLSYSNTEQHAVEGADQSTQETSNEIESAIQIATTLIEDGDWSSALKLLGPFDRSEHGEEILWLHVEAALGAGRSRKAIALLPRIAEYAKGQHDVAGEHRATRRLADLVLETEGAEDVALKLYRRALALDPSDLIAAELCAEMHEDDEMSPSKRRERPSQTEQASANTGPTNEALALRAKARKALGAGDLATAIEMLEGALALAPHIPSLHHECAEMALAADDPAKAAHWLEALAAHIETRQAGHSQYRASLSDLHLQIAGLYYDTLASPAKARHHMRCAANSCTSEMRRAATLRQLASEAASAGCLAEAISAYEAIGLENLSSHERLAAAKLYQQLSRDHASIKLLESARLAGTLTNDGRTQLFALHRNRARNQELAQSLERGARSAPKTIATTRLVEALRIYEHILDDAEGTARVRVALLNIGAADKSPGEPLSSVAELESASEAAAATGDAEVAASLLSRAIQKHCQELSAMGGSIDGVARALLDSLRNRVFNDRSNSQIAGLVPRTGPSAREVHALVRGLSAVANIDEDRDSAARLLKEIAVLRYSELHDIRGAADSMAQALALRADDPEILAELSKMLTEAGDHTQLASAYELHLSTIEGPRRALPLIELGKICHHVFGEGERARRCYDEAEHVDSGVAEQVRMLRQTLGVTTQLGNHAEQELSAEIDRALAMESQGRHSEALDLYEAAATTAPQDPRPFLALRRIYEDRKEKEKLSQVLEQLTTLSRSRQERASIFFERAMLARDEFHDDVLVYEYLKEAAANDPENSRYSHALRTISMARGEWALAAELTYREIGASTDNEELGALYLELALIFDEKLLDAPQALANYEQALNIDPNIPAAPRPLARLYELASRHDEAADMYQKAAVLSPDPTERGRLLRHAAMNAEQAELGDLAVSLYSKLAKEAGENDRQTALEATRRIEAETIPPGTSSKHSFEELQARLKMNHGDPTERARVLYELGMAYQHNLRDPNAAVKAYEESLSLDPNLLIAKDALADLCYQQRDWPRAHHLYRDIQPELSTLPPAEVALRRAEIAEAMGNETEAFEAFKWALEFAPDDTKVLGGLCRCASRVGEDAQALLAQQTLVRLIPVEEVERLHSARVFLADLCLSFGDLEGAIRSYEDLLVDIPDSVVAKKELPRLYLKARLLEKAIAALIELVRITSAHGEKAQLLFELGESHAEYSDDPELATEAYFRAIDLNPLHVPTLRRLLAYYSDEGDFLATSEMAADLLRQNALLGTQTSIAVLYRAGLAAALSGDLRLARTIGESLGSGAPEEIARAIREFFELANSPSVGDLAEAARNLCDAAGDDLNAVSLALGKHESAKNIVDLIDALNQLAV